MPSIFIYFFWISSIFKLTSLSETVKDCYCGHLGNDNVTEIVSIAVPEYDARDVFLRDKYYEFNVSEVINNLPEIDRPWTDSISNYSSIGDFNGNRKKSKGEGEGDNEVEVVPWDGIWTDPYSIYDSWLFE